MHIVGGGIVGCMIARKIKLKNPSIKVTILEQEIDLGLHASRKNSAVMHSGLYYKSDSFKAKFCKDGNQKLTQYCTENKIPYVQRGKFIVPTSEAQYQNLLKLEQQAHKNGVEVKLMDYKEAVKLEPYLKRYDYKYLYSPTTKVADSNLLMEQLHKELKQLGVNILTRHQVVTAKQNQIEINANGNLIKQEFEQNYNNQYKYSYLINSAGSFATQIAHKFNLGLNYRQHSVQGRYVRGQLDKASPYTLIYPVPNLDNLLYLGVHTTTATDGIIKVGPSKQFQQYNKFQNQRQDTEVKQQSQKIVDEQNPQSHSPQLNDLQLQQDLFKEVSKITTYFDNVEFSEFQKYFKLTEPGYRAQIFDNQKNELVYDFTFLKGDKSFHILNLVSPGWTSAISIADYVVDQVLKI